MKKKLHQRLESLPIQHRAAKVDSFDYDKRTVTFALTSENPVSRWYGDEILDHSKDSIDTNRLGRGVAMLFNHDPKQHIGRIENHEIKDGKLYVTARFGNSALATEKLNDVRDGILVDASAGYIPHDYEYTEGRSGKPDTVRWTRWEPVEGSLVPIPADPTVGIGRSLDDSSPKFPVRCIGTRSEGSGEPDEDDPELCESCGEADCECAEGSRNASRSNTPAAADPNEVHMTEDEKRALEEAAARTAAQTERERVKEINALQREHSNHFTLEAAGRAVDEGVTVDAVRAIILKNQRDASKASAVRSGDGGENPGVEVTVEQSDKGGKGVRMARTLRCLAAGRGDFGRAARFAREIGDQLIERSFAAAASSAVDGGYVLQGNVSGEIIELLRPVAVVRSLGPNTVPLDGTFTQNRLTAGASGSYIGENQDIKATKGKFGQLKLSAKKLAAIIPVSNDLLRRNGGAAADEAVRNDLVISLANTEDVSFIRSQGTQYTPKGLRYWCLANNLVIPQAIAELTGSALVAAVKQDLGKLKLALREANVKFVRPGFMLSPRTEYFLQNLLNDLGLPVFEAEMARGMLQGYPYKVTTQIPENLTVNGSSGNGSEIYFADFADVTIGDAPQIGIEFSTEASYIDPTTNQLVSAFSQDQTVMRVIIEHDIGMRHPEGLAILNGVTWGS